LQRAVAPKFSHFIRFYHFQVLGSLADRRIGDGASLADNRNLSSWLDESLSALALCVC